MKNELAMKIETTDQLRMMRARQDEQTAKLTEIEKALLKLCDEVRSMRCKDMTLPELEASLPEPETKRTYVVVEVHKDDAYRQDGRFGNQPGAVIVRPGDLIEASDLSFKELDDGWMEGPAILCRTRERIHFYGVKVRPHLEIDPSGFDERDVVAPRFCERVECPDNRCLVCNVDPQWCAACFGHQPDSHFSVSPTPSIDQRDPSPKHAQAGSDPVTVATPVNESQSSSERSIYRPDIGTRVAVHLKHGGVKAGTVKGYEGERLEVQLDGAGTFKASEWVLLPGEWR